MSIRDRYDILSIGLMMIDPFSFIPRCSIFPANQSDIALRSVSAALPNKIVLSYQALIGASPFPIAIQKKVMVWQMKRSHIVNEVWR